MHISCFRRRCSVNVFGNRAGGASRRVARALHCSSDLGRRLELVAQRFGCWVLSLGPRTTFHIQSGPSRRDCSAATFILHRKYVFYIACLGGCPVGADLYEGCSQEPWYFSTSKTGVVRSWRCVRFFRPLVRRWACVPALPPGCRLPLEARNTGQRVDLKSNQANLTMGLPSSMYWRWPRSTRCWWDRKRPLDHERRRLKTLLAAVKRRQDYYLFGIHQNIGLEPLSHPWMQVALINKTRVSRVRFIGGFHRQAWVI